MYPGDNYGLERPPVLRSSPVVRAIPPAQRVAKPPAARTRKPTRWWLAGPVAASAGAVVVGILTPDWFTAGGSGAGLLGVETCRRGACVVRSWSDAGAPAEVGVFSTIGLVGALTSIVMVGIVVALVLVRRDARIMYRIFTGALGVAAFGCMAFMARLSGELAKGLSIGYAGFVMFAGLVGLAVATRFLVRR
jgi:hypothetical protein